MIIWFECVTVSMKLRVYAEIMRRTFFYDAFIISIFI